MPVPLSSSSSLPPLIIFLLFLASSSPIPIIPSPSVGEVDLHTATCTLEPFVTVRRRLCRRTNRRTIGGTTICSSIRLVKGSKNTQAHESFPGSSPLLSFAYLPMAFPSVPLPHLCLFPLCASIPSSLPLQPFFLLPAWPNVFQLPQHDLPLLFLLQLLHANTLRPCHFNFSATFFMVSCPRSQSSYSLLLYSASLASLPGGPHRVRGARATQLQRQHVGTVRQWVTSSSLCVCRAQSVLGGQRRARAGRASRRREFCHSAAPPSPFNRCFQYGWGEGVSKIIIDSRQWPGRAADT